MASKQISVGIGIPMIAIGAILAVVMAPMASLDLQDTVQFVGSLIGTLGALIFIAGLFARKKPHIVS